MYAVHDMNDLIVVKYKKVISFRNAIALSAAALALFTFATNPSM